MGKPYSASTDNGKKRVIDEKKSSEEGTPTSVKCFKCGELDHYDNDCRSSVLRCFKCGKTGHRVADCKSV